MEHERIVVLDFGGQYNQLIARCVRDNGVYAEIIPYDAPIEKIRGENLKGIIMTGGPDSVYLPEAKLCDRSILSLGVPVLGICYGMQVITQLMGGRVDKASVPEFGRTFITLEDHPLFKGSRASLFG